MIKGIEAKDRTFLNMLSQRTILNDLSKTKMKKSDLIKSISKMRKLKKTKNLDLVINLLDRLASEYESVPSGFDLLLDELFPSMAQGLGHAHESYNLTDD